MSAAATGRGAKGEGSVAAGRTGRAPWGDGRDGWEATDGRLQTG